MNTYNCTGRLGRDPELKKTEGGLSICSFVVAINDGWGEKKKTIWMDTTAFQGVADSCQKFLTKGSEVAVTGRLAQDEWTDKETGKKRSKIKLIASNVDFIGDKQAPVGGKQNDDEDDDIPF